MPSVAITGGSSGLGWALAQAMLIAGWKVINLSPEKHPDKEIMYRDNLLWVETDVRDYISVKLAASTAWNWDGKPVNALVNCAGINRIGWLEEMHIEDWDLVMDTNARGIFYMVRAFLDHLKQWGARAVVCNVVSDAAWKPMSGSSAYNASKGAAHILTLQLARELTKRYGISVFGVAPGKMEGTGMSQYIDKRVCEMRGWTQEQAFAYGQLGRLHEEEIPVEALADLIAFIIGHPSRHRYLSGCIIPYGA